MRKPAAPELRILPVDPKYVVYPEHGTGRTAKLDKCIHCGGKPLILRQCTPRRTALSARSADSTIA
jgi:hypothetical protein